MKRLLFILVLFSLQLSLFVVPAFSAGQALVPRTGQTTSFVSGDDGDLQMGVAWPNPRFIDNANGTVTDNLTGLIWLKNANCFGYTIWTDAVAFASALASGPASVNCGLSDGSKAGEWRLPNRKELKSLVNRQQPNLSAWLNGSGFFTVQPDYYWSSSTLGYRTDSAWNVRMYDGDLSGKDKGGSYYAWPVR